MSGHTPWREIRRKGLQIAECEALGGHVQLWDSNWHWRCLWCAYQEDVPGGAVGGVKPL